GSGISSEVLQGLSEHRSQTCSSTQYLETRDGVVALQISRPDHAIWWIYTLLCNQRLRLGVPAFDDGPPLRRRACCQRRLRGLHTREEPTELPGQGWGIVVPREACGGFKQFCVPHLVQICPTTGDLPVADNAFRRFAHPSDAGEIAPTVFQLSGMQ